MKYIIAGGRDFSNHGVLERVLKNFPDIDTVISGCAPGADTLGAEWAAAHHVAVQTFPAYWNVYGKSAGFIRNAEMGEHADALIAFWDGKSKGTKNSIDIAEELNKKLYVIKYERIEL